MIRGEGGGEPANGLIGMPQGTHIHTFEIGAPRSSYGFKQQDNDSPSCGAVRTPMQELSASRATASGVGGGHLSGLFGTRGRIGAELINAMPATSVVAVKSSCGASKKPQTC
jgi:hypothetical protein